ncbi:hypothetical protein PInf_024240 [Phytophthora infestans]|nr:hypothetical protein PInf_024240 [Phytophthora infestans]
MSMDGFVDLVDDLLRVSDDKKEVVTKKSRSEVSVLDLVVSGDAEGLTQLLKDDADFAVNARDPKTGRALLHEACARGDMGIVKLLLMKTEADLMLRTMLVSVFRVVAKLLVQYGGKALDYNTKKKHAVESVSNFANSIRQDSSIPVDKRDAALDVYKNLVKYLEKQAEAEYRAKLMNLQKIKKQTKEQAVLKSPKKGKRRI